MAAESSGCSTGPTAEGWPAGRSTFGTFLMIILGIFGVLLVLRLIGGLFNRSAGQGYPVQVAWECQVREWVAGLAITAVPAMAARRRVLLERAGRSRRSARRQLAIRPIQRRTPRSIRLGRHGLRARLDRIADQGGDAIIGADDDPGGGTSWDDGGGGGDVGGGGDWGGGGGDWGGGGGDWGGGGG